jgi:hypothetical protein
MGARHKLNLAYFHGSLLLAAVAGWLLQSWLMFLVTLVLLVAFNLYANEIRPTRPRRHGGSGR